MVETLNLMCSLNYVSCWIQIKCCQLALPALPEEVCDSHPLCPANCQKWCYDVAALPPSGETLRTTCNELLLQQPGWEDEKLEPF